MKVCRGPSSFEGYEHRHRVILVRQIETLKVTEAFHGGEVIECHQKVSTHRAANRQSRIAFRTTTGVSNQLLTSLVRETV